MKFAGFDWDDGNRAKCLKHGVAIAEIEALFAGNLYIVEQTMNGTEPRTLGCGAVGRRWIFCVFTMRRARVRPVSVRFMHEKEVKRYVEEISRSQER